MTDAAGNTVIVCDNGTGVSGNSISFDTIHQILVLPATVVREVWICRQ